MFRIGVIGNGYVGKATSLLAGKDIEVLVYDKDPDKCIPRGVLPKDFYGCDFVFVCVPTPMKSDGSCDISIVESVCRELKKHVTGDRIVIRSTVPVGTCKYMGTHSMPEFLTESNWENDFRESKFRLIGLTEPRSYRMQKMFTDLFWASFKGGSIAACDSCFCSTEESELTKYTRNAFLATKVSFFNEVEEYCNKKNIDFNMVSACVTYDERIGSSHTKVPGPDGKRGFGGHCFPKDLSSLISQMDDADMMSVILKAVKYRNNEIDLKRLPS